MSDIVSAKKLVRAKSHRSSQTIYEAEKANELVFAVVGHVGSGTSEVAKRLKESLKEERIEAEILKASDAIRGWAEANQEILPRRSSPKAQLSDAIAMQQLGDKMREAGDHAAVAAELIKNIRTQRASWQSTHPVDGEPVIPDGKPRAYILDSLRHPAEVELLRRLYGSSFMLIGIVCDEAVRKERITKKFGGADQDSAQTFMKSDAHAPDAHGQRVSQAFYLSDFFLDNTPTQEKGKSTTGWLIPEHLGRLIKIIRHLEIMRPDPAETAMYYAHGAALRSACLSRQVGAALVDKQGNLIATGTNDVPRAGGGLYGALHADADDSSQLDGRCAYDNETKHYCRNTREQNEIIDDLISSIPELKSASEDVRRETDVRKDLRKTRIGSLLEFSRAVHAEMEALMAACRCGISTIGSRMFVTTEPCHPCTRHLLSAGIDEVQYIEPYPKSLALKLHGDAITQTADNRQPPSLPSSGTKKSNPPKMLFRPFVGVSPRLYSRAFLKDRDLKDDASGDRKIGDPKWGTSWDLRRVSYVHLEAALCKEGS